MRFSFNLPGRVTKIKIILTEEHNNDIVQEKSYTFKRDQFKVFENDHQRSAFINSLIGPEWINSDDIRIKKKEQRAKRKEEKRHPWGAVDESKIGLNKEEFEQDMTEGSVVVGTETEEGGNE